MYLDPDLDQRLALHALDSLEPDEVAALELVLAADPDVRAILAGYRDAAGALGAGGPQHAPDPLVRVRLLASLDELSEPGRLDSLAGQLGALFDVTVDKARMFLRWIDEPARWKATGLPGVQQMDIPPGPAWTAAACRLLRMAPRSRFPLHSHQGEEVTLVLEGEARYGDGTLVTSGDQVIADDGSSHEVTVEDEECLFAVRCGKIKILAR